MAARKSYLNFGGGERITPVTGETQFEFDDSDQFLNKSTTTEEEGKFSSDQTYKRSSSMHGSAGGVGGGGGGLLSAIRKPSRKPISSGNNVNQRSTTATTLPVDVPDWSRILGKEYRKRPEDDDLEEDYIGGCGGDSRYGSLPPHEYLARTRGSSFSVHEGIGRTLKGRDLSRLRNAVWKQTGFED